MTQAMTHDDANNHNNFDQAIQQDALLLEECLASDASYSWGRFFVSWSDNDNNNNSNNNDNTTATKDDLLQVEICLHSEADYYATLKRFLSSSEPSNTNESSNSNAHEQDLWQAHLSLAHEETYYGSRFERFLQKLDGSSCRRRPEQQDLLQAELCLHKNKNQHQHSSTALGHNDDHDDHDDDPRVAADWLQVQLCLASDHAYSDYFGKVDHFTTSVVALVLVFVGQHSPPDGTVVFGLVTMVMAQCLRMQQQHQNKNNKKNKNKPLSSIVPRALQWHLRHLQKARGD